MFASLPRSCSGKVTVKVAEALALLSEDHPGVKEPF